MLELQQKDIPGEEGFHDFELEVINVNDAPELVSEMSDQQVNEDANYSFAVPSATFTDIDVDDALSLTATLGDGSALPSWLTFDPASNSFIGTPRNNEVGMYEIKVTATDNSGAFVSDVYSLEVVNTNDAPEVVSGISDQQVNEDANYSFAVPSATFTDIDVDDALSLTATLGDGSALPSWLTFDPASNSFIGTPGNNEVGMYEIKVTATDNSGAFVSDVYSLKVLNVNDNPELVNELPDQEVDERTYYSYTIPANTFTDIDAGDELSLSITNADGGELPAWLMF